MSSMSPAEKRRRLGIAFKTAALPAVITTGIVAAGIASGVIGGLGATLLPPTLSALGTAIFTGMTRIAFRQGYARNPDEVPGPDKVPSLTPDI